MKSRQRRLMAIELTLTPKQVVLLWLRNARADLRSQMLGVTGDLEKGFCASAEQQAIE